MISVLSRGWLGRVVDRGFLGSSRREDRTLATPYWGPHFPDDAGLSFYWGEHFPDGVPDPSLVPGAGPAGAASFALDLESGAQLTLTFRTDVHKFYDGSEKRAGTLDAPAQKISGQAYIVGDATRSTRAHLARYAAIGQPFLIGLPYEELTIQDDTSDADVQVTSGFEVDWAVLGQRVMVQNGDGFVSGVVQEVDSGHIILDVSPGELGIAGSRIMPAMALYLEPQQGFARYPTDGGGVERWAINGRMVLFGFETEERKATVPLSGTATMAEAVAQWAIAGTAGNVATLTLVGDAPSTYPSPSFGYTDIVGSDVTYHFTPTETLVSYAVEILGLSGIVLIGSYIPDTVMSILDSVGPLAFAGGVDQNWGTMGAGASVAMHAGAQVWDRPLQLDGTATDSVQSMTEILDMGGVLVNIGTANRSDWGRQVMIRSDEPEEWQWLKAFLGGAAGRWKSWWLPTWRADLDPLSSSAGSLTIAGPSSDSGDFFAWYPSQRTHIQISQDDGTISYIEITAAVDNGDGTITLELDGGSTTLSGSDIVMVSWLELVRFESDEFAIQFTGSMFSMTTNARAIQQ